MFARAGVSARSLYTRQRHDRPPGCRRRREDHTVPLQRRTPAYMNTRFPIWRDRVRGPRSLPRMRPAPVSLMSRTRAGWPGRGATANCAPNTMVSPLRRLPGPRSSAYLHTRRQRSLGGAVASHPSCCLPFLPVREQSRTTHAYISRPVPTLRSGVGGLQNIPQVYIGASGHPPDAPSAALAGGVT